MDVLHVDGTGKQRCNFPRRESSDAASNFGDQESQLGMLLGEGDELLHVRKDGVRAALHGRDGIALSLQTNALTHDGTELLNSDTRCPTTVHTVQIAAKDEDFISFEAFDELRRDAVLELVHIAIVTVLAVRY